MSYAAVHGRRLAGLVLMGSATEPRCRAAASFRMVARLWEAMGAERVRQMHELTVGRRADARVWRAISARGESFGAVRAAWWAVMAHSGSWQLRRVPCPTLVLGGRLDVLHLQAARFAAPRGMYRAYAPSLSLEKYLELLLSAQGAVRVGSAEEADVILTVGKPGRGGSCARTKPTVMKGYKQHRPHCLRAMD